MRILTLLVSLALTACVVHTPVPQARIKRGPAFRAPLKKILALPTDCSSADDGLCTPAQGEAVDATTRMSLEFAGLRLVDSETVNSYLRLRVTREQRSVRTENGQVTSSGEQTAVDRETDEATWSTTTTERRRELLGEMGVDGYLTSLITVGEVQNLENQRTISVTVTITRASDGAIAWSSRCSVETGRFYFADEAVEVAAKCALESAMVVGT